MPNRITTAELLAEWVKLRDAWDREARAPTAGLAEHEAIAFETLGTTNLGEIVQGNYYVDAAAREVLFLTALLGEERA